MPTWKSDSNFCGGVFDLDGKQKRVEELNKVTSQPDFWNDSEKAQGILKEQASLKDVIDSWEKYRSALEEARFFLDLGKDEKSEEALSEAASKVAEVAQGMEPRRKIGRRFCCACTSAGRTAAAIGR